MPVTDDPSEIQKVLLRRWRVMEIEAPDGTRSRHVWGHDVTNNKGRASSAIVEFNVDEMTAVTRSGKHYVLVGLPGNSRLGKSAWTNWRSKNLIASELDVTKEYMNIDQLSTATFQKINNSLTQ